MAAPVSFSLFYFLPTSLKLWPACFGNILPCALLMFPTCLPQHHRVASGTCVLPAANTWVENVNVRNQTPSKRLLGPLFLVLERWGCLMAADKLCVRPGSRGCFSSTGHWTLTIITDRGAGWKKPGTRKPPVIWRLKALARGAGSECNRGGSGTEQR